MSERSENSLTRIKELFAKEPDAEEISWMILNNFYHYLLTWMEKNNVSKADLARILGKSRAAITKMFLHNPNISIKKIVEITYPLGLDIRLGIEQVPESLWIQKSECLSESLQLSLVADTGDWQEVPKLEMDQGWNTVKTSETVTVSNWLNQPLEENSGNIIIKPTENKTNDFNLPKLIDSQNKVEYAYA